jgi:8-oxo-dGTP diphosphatase
MPTKDLSVQLEVGVKALIKSSQGQYLFIKRKDPLPDGSGVRWDVPGGRIHNDELLQTALEREIEEETGMSLGQISKLLAAQDVIVPETQRHIVRLTYLVSADGKLALSAEHQEYKWLSLEDSLTLNVDKYLLELLRVLSA